MEGCLNVDDVVELLEESRKVERRVLGRLKEKNVPYLNSHKAPSDLDSFTTQFKSVAVRSPARIDVRSLPPPFTSSPILDNAELKSMVSELLGDDYTCNYLGLIHSLPTSTDQSWHQDGLPLFPGTSLEPPPYSLNVFIPLHKVTNSLGPTQFIPSSHKGQGAKDANDNPTKAASTMGTIAPMPKPGDVLVYDYRTVHRGTGNTSDETRHMLYLMFSRPWFKEHYNFGEEVLFDD